MATTATVTRVEEQNNVLKAHVRYVSPNGTLLLWHELPMTSSAKANLESIMTTQCGYMNTWSSAGTVTTPVDVSTLINDSVTV